MSKNVKYPVKGFWKVTTEGDVEGRSTRQLGTHEGYIDDIAFKLADQQYYGLRFEMANPKELALKPKSEKTQVNVSLGIESGTWDIKNEKLVEFWSEFLKDRDVSVGECNYYACVTLYAGKDNEKVKERAKKKLEAERAAARNKLTTHERQLLGVK